jgi:hypothetical protein
VQPAAAKAAIDFAALTARLKPRPFKTRSKSEFFRSLLKGRLIAKDLRHRKSDALIRNISFFASCEAAPLQSRGFS